MRKACTILAVAALAFGIADRAMAAPPAAPSPEQIAFFEKNIRPLLVDQCYRCHSTSAAKVKGGLKVDSLAALLAGGDTGPAVVPGDLKHSLLITAVRYTDKDLQMPPKTQLPAEQVKLLEQWVQMGAPHPDAATPASGAPMNGSGAGAPAKASGGHAIDIAKGRTFWAYSTRRSPRPRSSPTAPGWRTPSTSSSWPASRRRSSSRRRTRTAAR
jgi:hypothetical protein